MGRFSSEGWDKPLLQPHAPEGILHLLQEISPASPPRVLIGLEHIPIKFANFQKLNIDKALSVCYAF